MDEILKTLPQHTCSWSKGKLTYYKYQNFWGPAWLLGRGISAHQRFKAEPNDIFLCSAPKTGTTWLKSLTFAIATREKFDESTNPLLTKLSHECVPYLQEPLEELEGNIKNSSVRLLASHFPYASLPESVIASNCKIVYIYRNAKDVIVSSYHFIIEALKIPMEEAPFEEAFEEFCEGIYGAGPYWDHILGYWKASLERPDKVLLLKYEDLKREPTSNVKRLAEFIGYPFSIEEDKAGAVDKIINLCSFENLSNLEVNKTGKQEAHIVVENRTFFRKAKDGDWKNYFTDEMKEKIDKLMEEKLSGTGLVLT